MTVCQIISSNASKQMVSFFLLLVWFMETDFLTMFIYSSSSLKLNISWIFPKINLLPIDIGVRKKCFCLLARISIIGSIANNTICRYFSANTAQQINNYINYYLTKNFSHVFGLRPNTTSYLTFGQKFFSSRENANLSLFFEIIDNKERQ